MDEKQGCFCFAGRMEQCVVEYSADSSESSKVELEIIIRNDAQRELFSQ